MYKTFDDFGVKVPANATGNVKTVCPKCSADRKNKQDKCLSVNVSLGVGNCHNCGWKFSLNTGQQQQKIYSRPVEAAKLEVSDKVVGWFEQRGISKATLSRFKVSEEKVWMPDREANGKKLTGERNTICFNYYRDGELINVKYRDALKGFRLYKDAQLIFYNLDGIANNEEAIICEGEIDALSFFEAGMPNVVSVPNGASKGSQKLEYLDNCLDYFDNKKKIIIATDGDEAGQVLANELVRRLGAHRCFKPVYPADCKDANEILTKHGKGALLSFLLSAAPIPVGGVYTAKRSDADLDAIYLYGYPSADKSGYMELDNHITFAQAQLTVVSGIPNSGKSDFLDQILLRLAMRKNWRVGMFSAENQPPYLHVIKLLEKLVGQPYFRYDGMQTMSRDVRDKAIDMLSDKFFFMRVDEVDVTLDGILEKAEELVHRYGINALVIDPYNCIEHNIPRNQTETQYISDVLEKIRLFKVKFNVHVFLVVHPTKMGKIGDAYEVPDLYKLAGSANFFNKTDNGIVVYRNNDNTVDIHIQKVRWKWVGKKGVVRFVYDVPTGRYAEEGGGFTNEFAKAIDGSEDLRMQDTYEEPPF